MKKQTIALFFVVSLVMSNCTAFAAVKTMADGGKFDAAFYGATYPDVAAAFGSNEQLLYQHYLTNGRAEGRRPYAAVRVMPDGGLFDAAFYAAVYPDVKAAFGTNEQLLYQHYLSNGKAEGRLPYAVSASATVAAGPAAVTALATPVAAPVLQKGVDGGIALKFSWTPVPGADGYEIKCVRQDWLAFPKKVMLPDEYMNTTNTSIIQIFSHPYNVYYQVRAYKGTTSKIYSGWSNTVEGNAVEIEMGDEF